MASSANMSSRSCMPQLLLFILVSACFLQPLSLDAQKTNNSAVQVDSPLRQVSFSFDFSNASSYEQADFLLEGSASLHRNLIDLTCNEAGKSINDCSGRMSYRHPVPFHDGTTLASFSTRFTFVIGVNKLLKPPGDGMAFFISGYPSSMPLSSSGGNLGLLNGTEAYGEEQFVAVEFDTFKNDWDPSDSHIGIDINSVHSVNTTSFLGSSSQNANMSATITFDNITQMLVASLQIDDDPSMQPVVVSTVLPDPKSLLPSVVAVGFSAATGAINAELHQILAWSFNSTLAAVPSTNSTLAAPSPHKGQDITIAKIIGGALLSVVLLVFVAWFIFSYWKWTNRHGDFEKLGKQQGPTQFEYNDLAAATDNFSDERKLGGGFFGVVYRGNLKKLGREVAVKKILNKSHVVPGLLDTKNFFYELNAISSVKHKNLVELVGWCRGSSWNFVEFMCCCWKNKNNKLFLVYELMPKGSLDEHLHTDKDILPWETRYRIVKDIASVLRYLHHDCNPFILHRDIKPRNILLDKNFNAKLADFGLSRIIDSDSSEHLTEAYLDPQCKQPFGKVAFSRSSDVYSLGIVLLDIACKKGMFREQVWKLYTNGSILEAADDKLQGEFHRIEMENVISLGLWCSYPDDSKKRPSMEQVMAVLEHGRSLPDLNSLENTSVSMQQEVYIDPQVVLGAAASIPSGLPEMGDQQRGVEDLERILSDVNAEPIQIPYAVIKSITKNFAQVIGSGGFGVVYLGGLQNGMVAVKKLITSSFTDKQFLDEVACLKRVKHKNIAKYIGYCLDTQECLMEVGGKERIVEAQQRLLCFEYVPNGNLHHYLKENIGGFGWSIRYKIIKGICEGLHYLHQKRINHLDLKPANVLLGVHMEPKITDFGLSRFIDENQSTIFTTNLRGTRGYIAPEFIDNQKISFKSDIFSLGIIMTRLLIGNNDNIAGNWHESLHVECQQMKICIEIAQICAEYDPSKRPTIADIILKLNKTETMVQNVPPDVNEPRNDPRSPLYQVVKRFWERPTQNSSRIF